MRHPKSNTPLSLVQKNPLVKKINDIKSQHHFVVIPQGQYLVNGEIISRMRRTM